MSGKSFSELLDDFDSGETENRVVERDVDSSPILDEIREWWRGTAARDADLVGLKYEEYGNTALEEVGNQIASVMGRTVGRRAAQQLGVWFFMQGKMARWKAAILKGQDPSEDTLQDLAVYAMMARNVQKTGSWPMGVD